MSVQVDVLAVMRDGAADYDESGHDGLADDMRQAIRAVAALIAERDALREALLEMTELAAGPAGGVSQAQEAAILAKALASAQGVQS